MLEFQRLAAGGTFQITYDTESARKAAVLNRDLAREPDLQEGFTDEFIQSSVPAGPAKFRRRQSRNKFLKDGQWMTE